MNFIHLQVAMNQQETASQYLSDPVLNELIEASNDGFWNWDIVTGEVYFSRRWIEMLGYTRNEITPNVSSWERLVHPDDRPHVMEVLDSHLKGKTDHYETEHRILTKSGEWKWILDRGRVISRAPDGSPLRAAGSHTDISDRVLREQEQLRNENHEKEAKKQLIELNAKLQDAYQIFHETFELAAVGIAHVSLNGKWLKANRALCQITGYSEAELKVKTFVDITHPDDIDIDNTQRIKLINGVITSYSQEKRYIKKNGDIIWINLTASVKRELNGTAMYFIFCLDDMTARKNIEFELDKNQSILNAIMNSTTDLIYAKDKKSKLLMANQAVEKTLAQVESLPRPIDLIGKKPADFMGAPGEDIIKNDQLIMQSGKAITLEELIPTLKGNIFFESIKAPLVNSRAEVIGIVGISREITERKKIEQKLKDSIRVRNEFLSIASHELKTPLTSLMLLAQSMKRTLSQTSIEMSLEKIEKMTLQTEKQLLRLTHLVDDMLDITRIDSGKLILNKEQFDLYELIQEIAERLQPQIQSATGRPLIMSVLEHSVGYWDRHRIEQVITNLITNAIRYGKGRPIEFTLKNLEDTAEISVKDFGTGIQKEDQERIFNCFERAVNPNEVSGLGLGLFISKQIVDSHHGRIWVKSEVEHGSTFFVSLPKINNM
jgi:PAS domain S-box-containing protein